VVVGTVGTVVFPVPLAVVDGNFQEEKWCNYENYNAHIYILYII